MSKAGKASEGGVTSIGREHPLPENIPHASSPSGTNVNGNGSSTNVNSTTSGGAVPGATSSSPVKESSFLQRETSVDEAAGVISPKSPQSPENKGTTSPPAREGVPIRWQS